MPRNRQMQLQADYTKPTWDYVVSNFKGANAKLTKRISPRSREVCLMLLPSNCGMSVCTTSALQNISQTILRV